MNRQQFTRGFLFLALLVSVLALPVSVQAQPGNLLSNLAKPAAGQHKTSYKLVVERAAVGEVAVLQLQIELPGKDSYVYSLNPNVGAETKIVLDEIVGLEPIDEKFTASKEPKVVVEPLFDNAKLEKFFEGVTWTRKYRITDPNAKIKGNISYQICDEQTCVPHKNNFELSLQVVPASGSTPATPAAEKSSSKTPTLKMVMEEKETVPAPPVGNGADKPEAGKPESTAAADQVEKILPVIKGKTLASQTIQPKRGRSENLDPLTFDFQFVQDTGNPDPAVAVVAVTVDIEGDWHIYALSQDPEMAGLPTVINLDDIPGLTAIDDSFLASEQPEVTTPLEGMIQKAHHHQITWQRRYRVDPASFQGPVTGSLRYQLCNNAGCLPPQTVKFQLDGKSQTSSSSSNSLPISAESPIDDSSSEATGLPVEESTALHQRGLIPFLLTGMLFGYLALLTPCVFPMIPITISYFLKQAEKENHRPVGMAALYCLGIMTTFTVIGIAVSAIFGISGMNQLANNPWINLFLAGVLIFFGFNMLGMFEIRVPSWLLTWSSSKERSGGVLGVLFMAFTFTLVSFTCTFAFVGLLLPMAAQGDYYWPTLGMLAFSAAFASPFFFLALFPSFLKKLPKSGGWMNKVKVTFGLLELGAAVKFLSVADISLFRKAFVMDYTLVMVIWIVMSALIGLYLLGMFRMSHDSPEDHIGVVRLSIATVFLCLAVYLGAGIFSPVKPDGVLWQQIAAFAPPQYETKEDVDLGPTLVHDDLIYAMDVDQAVKFASANNQPMFFDFTGVNCVNCRFMEINVFPQQQPRQLLEQLVRVQLFTDTIPHVKDASQAEKLLERNLQLQADWFKSASMPAYAVVTPDGKTILSSLEGKNSQADFIKFLQTGLNEWQRIKTAGNAESLRR